MSDKHQTESAMNPSVSAQSTLPNSPDVEPIASFDKSRNSENNPGSGIKHVHPEFAFSDGNIEVQIRNQLFWLHEYQLNNFTKLAQLIEDARAASESSSFGHRIGINCDASRSDFVNTLRVIYASVIKGPFQFDRDILVSVLRIATIYDYPDLRKFAIAGLEKANLTAIDRIRLLDEFDLPSWEMPAFMELCKRQEPITSLEAKVLGIDRFVELAQIREAEQRHQFIGHVVGLVKSHCLAGAKEKPLVEESLDVSVPISLPSCDCRASRSGNMTKCDMHNVAPQVLVKYQSLLKERNRLQEDLDKVVAILASQQSKNRSWAPEGSSSVDKGSKYISLEDELKKTTWARLVRSN